MEIFDLVIVMPVGPGTNVGYASDTIDSIYWYCHCSFQIIVIDDSLQGLGCQIKELHPGVELIINKRSNGLNAGLYITLAKAYSYIIRNFRFKALFKVDTDALIIGMDPQETALTLFASDPATGFAGLYKSGNEVTDFSDSVFDNSWPRNYLFDVTCTWKIFKRPVANFTLRKYMLMAFRKGFNMGDNVFGGAYFMSAALLLELDRLGFLPDSHLRHSRMEEDHLFSVLTNAAGFRMADLAAGDLPFAMNWKKLPAAPGVLLARNKKVIHSTRQWEQMDELTIRRFFKDRRR